MSNLQTAFCLVVKNDPSQGVQIAVTKGELADKQFTGLPCVTGNPQNTQFLKPIKSILDQFDVTSQRVIHIPELMGAKHKSMGVVAEVAMDTTVDKPFEFIPLTGAYTQLSNPQMQNAVVQLCSMYKQPLVNPTRNALPA